MMIATLISLIYQDGVTLQLFLAGLVTLLIGTFAMVGTRNHRKEMNKREGYIVVAFGWIVMSLTGTLPYLVTESISTFTDAFFETMSGYTTTGASILNDIEILPEGVLFWRSTTHWIGGMGIIVLAIAILPLLGVGGMQLFKLEGSDSSEKLMPRTASLATEIIILYFILSSVCALTPFPRSKVSVPPSPVLPSAGPLPSSFTGQRLSSAQFP